jgi:hypothetical protein
MFRKPAPSLPAHHPPAASQRNGPASPPCYWTAGRPEPPEDQHTSQSAWLVGKSGLVTGGTETSDSVIEFRRTKLGGFIRAWCSIGTMHVEWTCCSHHAACLHRPLDPRLVFAAHRLLSFRYCMLRESFQVPEVRCSFHQYRRVGEEDHCAGSL